MLNHVIYFSFMLLVSVNLYAQDNSFGAIKKYPTPFELREFDNSNHPKDEFVSIHEINNISKKKVQQGNFSFNYRLGSAVGAFGSDNLHTDLLYGVSFAKSPELSISRYYFDSSYKDPGKGEALSLSSNAKLFIH